MNKINTHKIIAHNRRAKFDYIIEEEVEAGIILSGSEVKSLRLGKVSINEAYAAEMEGGIFLINANISEYKNAVQYGHAPKRPRMLLLHKKQISKLIGQIQTKGLSLIPLSLYFNHRNIAKIKLGLGRGKKLYDKRAAIKEKDEKRQKMRAINED